MVGLTLNRNSSITKVDQSVKNRATLSVEQKISCFIQVV